MNRARRDSNQITLAGNPDARSIWDKSTVFFGDEQLDEEDFQVDAVQVPYVSDSSDDAIEEEQPKCQKNCDFVKVQPMEEEPDKAPEEGLFQDRSRLGTYGKGMPPLKMLGSIRPKQIIRLEKVNSFFIGTPANNVVNNRIFNVLRDYAHSKGVSKIGNREISCSCWNSRCEARYCSCFGNGLACGPKCSCTNCYNIEDRPEKPGVIKESKGCKCERTRCQKRYCECFKSGAGCGTYCRCLDCLNQQTIAVDETQQMAYP